MENQVLTIEQMQELIDMGIDVSKASMYISEYGEIVSNVKICERDINWSPTFTLQDLLDMLPQGFYLEQNTTSLDKKVFLQINKTAGGGYSIAYEQSWDEDGKLKIKMHGQQLNDSLLEAAFNMLKWCKQNNYI